MKHTISVTRDMLDPEGVLVAVETETLEIDSLVDDPTEWEHYMARGVFAEVDEDD